MLLALTSEQGEWKRAARRFLSSHCASSQIRSAMGSERGHDAAAWRGALKLGWASVVVPEAHRGAGLRWTELVGTAEESGRALACLPFFSTVCLGTNALLAAADEAQLARHLPRIAAGDELVTLAFAENARAEPFDIATVAREREDGYELSGEKRYVLDGDAANLLLVTARAPGTSAAEGVTMFVVDAAATGVELQRLPTMDQTRPLATIRLRDVRVGRDAKIGDARAVRGTLDRASVALAAEALGGAERCLEMATEYAKARVQLGRPIGSVQAIKHKLADMLVAVETSRSAVYYAAAAIDASNEAELATAAPLAKSYCTEAFFRCAAENIQIHGGIGFTWEHDAHLFLKRARGSLALLGSTSNDRERIARAIAI